MNRTQLIKAVQVRIDDVVTDNAIEVVSNQTIDQILDEQLSNAFKFLPVRFLPFKPITGTITETQAGLSEITLPTDFLRLVRFNTTNLTRPVTESDLVTEGGRDHIFMYYSYVSGGNSRIRACVTKNTGLKLMFNTSAPGTVTEGFYIAIPTPEDVTVEILDPVAWYIASTTLQIMGEVEAGKAALNKVTEFLTTK